MATASFIFTTPVAQPQQTGVLLGSPISLNLSTGDAVVPYVNRTSLGQIPGTETALHVALTQADFQTIMAVIISRAQALGIPIPAGSVVVGP